MYPFGGWRRCGARAWMGTGRYGDSRGRTTERVSEVSRVSEASMTKEPFELEKLLWDLRHDPSVVDAFGRDADRVLRDYEISEDQARALLAKDFATLLALGTAPMLLYFGALELGVAREEYYAALRAGPRSTDGPEVR